MCLAEVKQGMHHCFWPHEGQKAAPDKAAPHFGQNALTCVDFGSLVSFEGGVEIVSLIWIDVGVGLAYHVRRRGWAAAKQSVVGRQLLGLSVYAGSSNTCSNTRKR